MTLLKNFQGGFPRRPYGVVLLHTLNTQTADWQRKHATGGSMFIFVMLVFTLLVAPELLECHSDHVHYSLLSNYVREPTG